MNPKVKEDILTVLNSAIEILKEREGKDLYELKELSNHVIHNAGIFQDEHSITIAVLIYSIYKVLERMPFIENRNYSKFLLYLRKAKQFLEKDDMARFNSEIKILFKTIESLDHRLKKFVEEVVRKARINKGSKLVEHGISVAQASSLMGISQWELMSYIGKTEIVDKQDFKEDVKKRLNYARKLFK